MTCFGEYLAEIAADGGDVSAPVPLRPRSLARMARAANCPACVMADEYTLGCGKPADGAQGDPAAGEPARDERAAGAP